MLHVWHTALAPEQFQARIQTRARSFGPDWRLRWKAVRGGYRLWLCPELPVFRVRGQLPLRLWVRPEGEGCRVTGVFAPPLWSLALDALAPPALTYAASLRTGRMTPWWVPAAMTVFLLLVPRMFTAWGRDRRLLRWVGEDLLGGGAGSGPAPRTFEKGGDCDEKGG